MGRKENNIDNLDLNLDTDFNLDLDLDENKDLVFPDGNEYFKNEDSRKYRLNTKSVLFRHAEEGAKICNPRECDRFDCIVSGDFVFGDFLEAWMNTHLIGAKRVDLCTLSLDKENVDSYYNLLKGGFIQRFNLIVSDYFAAHERNALMKYIDERLSEYIDKDMVTVSVVGSHCKYKTIETLGGKPFVIWGSANERSSANIEMFTLEKNFQLFSKLNELDDRIIANFAKSSKALRASRLWNELNK